MFHRFNVKAYRAKAVVAAEHRRMGVFHPAVEKVAAAGLNIENLVNKSRDSVAYTILDFDEDVTDELVEQLGNGLVITEIMTSNNGAVASADGTVSDWIEIYNGTDEDIDLTNYYTKVEVDQKIASAGHLKRIIVDFMVPPIFVFKLLYNICMELSRYIPKAIAIKRIDKLI